MTWPYPRVIAHRGGGAFAPENTLAALRQGKAMGFTGVEFDVMLSGDGVAVLIQTLHEHLPSRSKRNFQRQLGGSPCSCSEADLAGHTAGRSHFSGSSGGSTRHKF